MGCGKLLNNVIIVFVLVVIVIVIPTPPAPVLQSEAPDQVIVTEVMSTLKTKNLWINHGCTRGVDFSYVENPTNISFKRGY